MSSEAHSAARGVAQVQIAKEVLRVHRNSYGTGAGQVTVHLSAGWAVVILDELEFSDLEKVLLGGGHEASVCEQREKYEAALASTFRAIVERATGRSVSGFMSTVSTSPPYSVEIYRLGV